MFELPGDAPLASLFFAYMRHHGVHIWEGRPGFLTLAHSDGDLDRVAAAFSRSIEEMQRAGFLPRLGEMPPIAGARLGRDAEGKQGLVRARSRSAGQVLAAQAAEWRRCLRSRVRISYPSTSIRSPTTPHVTLPLTPQQSEVWVESQMGREASCAFNQCFVLHLRGPLSAASMQNALDQVLDRHAALRAASTRKGSEQRILPDAR